MVDPIVPSLDSIGINQGVCIVTILATVGDDIKTIAVLVIVGPTVAVAVDAVVPGFGRPRKDRCIGIVTIGTDRVVGTVSIAIDIGEVDAITILIYTVIRNLRGTRIHGSVGVIAIVAASPHRRIAIAIGVNTVYSIAVLVNAIPK